MSWNVFPIRSSIYLFACFFVLYGCTETKKNPGANKAERERTSATIPDTTLPASALPLNGHLSTVEIKGMKFIPEEITIEKGDTVVWVNNDLTNHCVTEAGKSWTSSVFVPGSSWKKAVAENTEYYCAIHVVMKGKIKVE